MAVARKLGVDQVVLFHHDPYHTDEELEVLLADAKQQWRKRQHPNRSSALAA